MKLILLIIIVLSCLNSFAQQEEFYLQGQVIDANKNPISDAYIYNERSNIKNVSRNSGIFDIRVLPGDSLIITHISFIRKVVTVYQLMVNPIVQLELDTVNIRSINVSADKMSDYKKAMENIDRIEFDFRPQPDDAYTETERMKNLFNTENQVERAYSNSLNFLQFSPSEQIGKLIDKRKKKKEARQFSSTKKENPEK